MWKNTVFFRLFLMFLIIMIPIYVVGASIYDWGVRAVRNEIYNSMIAQSTFYLNSLETEIQRIRFLQFECITDDNLNDLTFAPQTMDGFEKNRAKLRLQQRLNSIKSSSRYIEDVSVGISGLDITVSAQDGVIKGLDSSISDILRLPFISPSSQLIYRDGFLYSNAANSTYNTDKLHFNYLITIKLSEASFILDLAQFDTYKDSISLMTGVYKDFTFTGGDYGDNLRNMKEMLLQQTKGTQNGTFYEKINGKSYIVVYAKSDYLGFNLVRYIPEEEILRGLKNYQIWLWVFLLTSLVIIFLFTTSIYTLIHKPLRNLVRAFKKVEKGDFKINMDHRHNDEFRYLYGGFNTMVTKLDTLIDQVYKQKILMQNAQLKQLQAQINPHFLYNTFFILYSMASAEDNDSLMLFLKQLGNYFKFITRSGEDEVPLYREIEHAYTYSSIQQLRFSKRIRIEFQELPEEYRDLTVPRLIVQPIIENSFKYGLEDKESDGILSVSYHESDGFFKIIVEDNGAGMTDLELESLKVAVSDRQHTYETTGIVNIHRRLQLKFGVNSGLEISNNEMGGLKVVINIDLEGAGNV